MHTVMKQRLSAPAEWSLLPLSKYLAKERDLYREERNWLDTHKPDSWYQFCTMVSAKYACRGEPVASMIYWSMRFWDRSERHAETPEWWQVTCEYWDYKASWMEKRA